MVSVRTTFEMTRAHFSDLAAAGYLQDDDVPNYYEYPVPGRKY